MPANPWVVGVGYWAFLFVLLVGLQRLFRHELYPFAYFVLALSSGAATCVLVPLAYRSKKE